MSQELLYTSAPRGLKPGSRGFCTVLSTQGMPAPLATAAEALSGYRPVYPSNDERAARNPVVYSHLKMQAAGKSWHVLSRIADYGLDYSQRPNKLAHHVILDNQSERLPGGPANLLMMSGFMRDEWQGEPKVVALKPVTREPRSHTGVCERWKELTGDAGWAGVLAESFLKDPERLVILLFEPGQEILPLFAEAISLLPIERRWDVTFSTYFTNLATGTTCIWRAMINDSKEARESLRFVSAIRLDLTTEPMAGGASGGELIEAARFGRRPDIRLQISGNASAPNLEIKDRIDGADVGSDTIAPEFGEVQLANRHSKPPVIGYQTEKGRPPTLHSGRSKGTPNAINSESRSRYRRLIGWFAFPVIALAVFALVAICRGNRPNDRNSDPNAISNISKSDRVDAETTTSAEKPAGLSESSRDDVTKDSAAMIEFNDGQAKSFAGVAGNAGEVLSKTTTNGKDSNNEKPPVASDPQHNADSTNKPLRLIKYHPIEQSDVKPVRYSFLWANGGNVPKYTNFFALSAELKQMSHRTPQENFKMEFGRLPPSCKFYAPNRMKWKLQRVKALDGNNKTLVEIVDSENELPGPVAEVKLVERSGARFDYVLNVKPQKRSQMLAWCAIEFQESDATSVASETIFFHDPRAVLPDNVKMKRQRAIWSTSLPMHELPPEDLALNVLRIKFGKYLHSLANDKLKPTETTGDAAHFRITLTELKQLLKSESGVELLEGTEALLKVDAKSDKGALQIAAETEGVFEKNGLLDFIDSRLRNNIKDPIDSITKDAKKLNVDIESLRPCFSKCMAMNDDAPIRVLSSKVDEFRQMQISEIRKNSKDDMDRLDKLAGFEAHLIALPGRLEEAWKRQKRVADIKTELNNLRIVSANVSTQIFDQSDKTSGTPLEFVIVDFDEEKRSDAKPQEVKQ